MLFAVLAPMQHIYLHLCFCTFLYVLHGNTYSDVVWPTEDSIGPGVLDKDSFQNKRFKLIPFMVEAPWVIQMAVR